MSTGITLLINRMRHATPAVFSFSHSDVRCIYFKRRNDRDCMYTPLIPPITSLNLVIVSVVIFDVPLLKQELILALLSAERKACIVAYVQD
jgi:hypothetical protein